MAMMTQSHATKAKKINIHQIELAQISPRRETNEFIRAIHIRNCEWLIDKDSSMVVQIYLNTNQRFFCIDAGIEHPIPNCLSINTGRQ